MEDHTVLLVDDEVNIGAQGRAPVRFRLSTCSACGGELEIKLDAAQHYVECVRCGLDQETLRRRTAEAPLLPASKPA